jgi:hypothetical protein
MNEDQAAENIPVESTSTPAETPTVETNKPEPSVEESEPQADAAEGKEETNEESEPEQERKKSAQGRIKQLNSELKEERKKASQLEEKINSILKENEDNPFSPVNMPMPSPNRARLSQPNENGEITYEDYQRDVQENARTAVQAVLSQQRMREEVYDIVRNTPELDPNSDQFDPDLSEAITDAVEAKHRLSSNFSVKETVSKLLKPYRRAAEKAVDGESRNLATQVATAAVRPGPSPALEEKRFEDLSVEEMEAKLGKVY